MFHVAEIHARIPALELLEAFFIELRQIDQTGDEGADFVGILDQNIFAVGILDTGFESRIHVLADGSVDLVLGQGRCLLFGQGNQSLTERLPAALFQQCFAVACAGELGINQFRLKLFVVGGALLHLYQSIFNRMQAQIKGGEILFFDAFRKLAEGTDRFYGFFGLAIPGGFIVAGRSVADDFLQGVVEGVVVFGTRGDRFKNREQ